MGDGMGTEPSGSKGVELRKGAESQSIRIKFMYRGVECREPLKLTHTKQNINYATRLRGEILNAIERGTFKYADYFPDSAYAKKFGAAPAVVTVGELLREQLDIAERTLSPSTYRGYKQVYDSHLFEQWDKTRVVDLTPAALRAWVGTLDCKIKTVRNILTPLRNALEQAVNDDVIEYSPLERVKLAKIMPREARKSDFEPDPFDMAEITAILAACEGQERNVWRHAFATGMRTSEFIALEWPSIDWIHGRIGVDKVRVEGVTKDDAKTVAGLRQIDMLRGAYDALIDQQAHTKLAGGLVFHDPRYGKGWADDHALKKRWMIILRKAGVRYRNPYQTRHTFASTLLAGGANPLYVAKQMGHRDTEMITRNYGRWIEQGNDPETRKQLQEFFAQVSPTALLENRKPA
jgi:integrase